MGLSRVVSLPLCWWPLQLRGFDEDLWSLICRLADDPTNNASLEHGSSICLVMSAWSYQKEQKWWPMLVQIPLLGIRIARRVGYAEGMRRWTTRSASDASVNLATNDGLTWPTQQNMAQNSLAVDCASPLRNLKNILFIQFFRIFGCKNLCEIYHHCHTSACWKWRGITSVAYRCESMRPHALAITREPRSARKERDRTVSRSNAYTRKWDPFD